MARLLAALFLLGAAQDKKPAPPPIPKVVVALPLSAPPGRTTKLTLRGLNLDTATGVKVEGAEAVVKSKGKAAMPKDSEVSLYGDTQIELEVKIPAGLAAESVATTVTTPAGTSEPYALLVTAADRLVAEKEPNGGFSSAQPIESGQVVQGSIPQPLDVDVFRVAGHAGETWVFDVVAQRRGSPLDAMLSFYDPGGRILAVADDGESTRDATIKVTLPADGNYSLALIDAQNMGSAAHVYQLAARREP
jgi:hypothetical protein